MAGARESNAGDDFHVVWAARRAIRLLSPRTNLRRVLIERLSAVDEAASTKAAKDLFLGVDISEYFGGNSLDSSTHVVISQLKYSTRHPTRAWTAARLGKVGGKGASTIARMAEAFKGLSQTHSRDVVLQKLKIRLVSNQPIAEVLREALEAAQSILAKTASSNVVTSALLKQLTQKQAAVIQKLKGSAGLGSGEFTDFLRVLDLSRLGQHSRQLQRLALIQELSPLVTNDPVASLRALCDLIREEAQPQKSASLGLAEHDVLAALEVSNRENLFPVPPHFEQISTLIYTPDAKGLADVIAGAAAKNIVAHGRMGTGKTTTVQQLKRQLPVGSVVVLYDCFGGGSYKIPGEQRHPQRRAFRQLTNELALNCGTPFLVKGSQEIADLQRDFTRSLEMAAKVVAVERGGLLVIVIDAADNAAIAAGADGDNFVPVLWQIPLPDNCRLAMTCRTHRKPLLQSPSDAAEYELKGFDEVASAEHLRSKFPAADQNNCLEFHDRTGGNPRMQSYLLSRATSDPSAPMSVNDLFAGKRETLDGMFNDLLQSAIVDPSKNVDTRELLADLMSLTRPVPPVVLAEVHKVEPDVAINFCRSLEPGLILDADAVWFRDEDFEDFLLRQLSDAEVKDSHVRLARWFLRNPNQSMYSARFVAEHLYQGELNDELITLAVDGPDPASVIDEITRSEVQRRRVHLAMLSARRTGNELGAMKLLFVGAETDRVNSALATVIHNDLDLAIECGNPNSAIRIFLQHADLDSPGAAHLRIAAICSRLESEQDRALDHLKMGRAWLRRKFSSPNTIHWRISETDIAREAECVFWLFGSEEALRTLRNWRPASAVLYAGEMLTKSLANQIPPKVLEKELRKLKLPAIANAVILSALWDKGLLRPSHSLADRTSRRIERFLRRHSKQDDQSTHFLNSQNWSLSFCELMAAAGVLRKRVSYIASKLCPAEVVVTPPYYTFDTDYHDRPLRRSCLRAALGRKDLTVDDLMPEEYRETANPTPDRSRWESDRRRFTETIGSILNVYKTRASSIVAQKRVRDVAPTINSDLNQGFRQSYPVNRAFLFKPWATVACETLLQCKGDATAIFENIANEAERTVGSTAPEILEDLAKQLIRSEQYRQLAHRLLDRSARYVVDHPFSGRDRCEHFLTCASISSRSDEALSTDYYKRAVSAAEGIDDDLIPLLDLYCRVSRKLNISNEDGQNLAARLARLVESHRDYVPEEASHLYKGTIDAATRLSPADGFALCSRWDDEGFCLINQGILPLVEAATAISFITPLEGLSLLCLAGEEHDITTEALPLLERLRNEGANSRPELSRACSFVSNWIQKHLSLYRKKRASERTIEWAKSNSLGGLPGLAALQNLLNFTNSLTEEGRETRPSPYIEEKVDAADYKRLIDDAKDGSLERFEERIVEVWRMQYGTHIKEFLTVVGNNVQTSQRIEFLNRLVLLAADEHLAKLLVEPFLYFISEWRDHINVKQWTQEGVMRFLENALPALLEQGYGQVDLVRLLARAPNVQPNPSVVLSAIAQNHEDLGARGLYALAEVVAEFSSNEAVFTAINWSLARTESHFAFHHRPLATMPNPVISRTSAETLAQFLWAIFGHADKRVRWRALHAARQTITLPNQELVNELMGVADSTSAGPFRSSDSKLEFYPMSALSWLMLCFQRIADERPELLKDQSEALANRTLDTTFPHAQIRELVRLSVLSVIQRFPESLLPEVVQDLTLANQPVSCIHPRESKYTVNRRPSKQLSSQDSECFSFDTTDTIPYWIQPLSEVFACHTHDVTERARQWICNRWGRTDDDWHRDLRRRMNEYRWHFMSKRHGSIPTIENLHTYLEYHALLCTGGQMADERLPVSVDTYEDPEWPWSEWLSRHICSNPHSWLSDLRSPTPLLRECWGIWPQLDQWQKKSLSDYDIGLGIREPGHENEIVVAGYIDLWDRDRQGSYRVESAIVNPESAFSLLSALQTTSSPHDFNLEHAIAKPGFELTGWYDEERLTRGLDRFDPLARTDSESHKVPTDTVVHEMNLQRVQGTLEFRSMAGDKAAWLEVWSDQTEEHHEEIRSAFSQGQRLWVDRQTLLEYLNKIGRDLILEVKLARNSRLEGAKHEFGTSRIYLLRGSGRLETLAGSIEVGSANRN